MHRVFADAAFWIAKVNPADNLHEAAVVAEEAVGHAQIVTTDSVLSEVLARLNKRRQLRAAAAKLTRSLYANPNIEVVAQRPGLFARALTRYENLSDKTCSLVDCISMEVMDDFRTRRLYPPDAEPG